MTPPRNRHCWAVPDTDTAGESDLAPAPSPDLVVSCHRRLRGPFTAAGTLLRIIVPQLLERDGALVASRAIEIDAVAPELTPLVPKPPQTLTSLAAPQERTRFYPAVRAQRIAHGIAELLMDWARITHPGGAAIAFQGLTDADPTDRQLVSILLRRSDPETLTVIVEPGGRCDDELRSTLISHTQRAASRTQGLKTPAASEDELAQLFIDGECASPDPTLRDAYAALSDAERARRHSDRARRLAELGEPTLRIGAIPFHLEHGTDPAGAGVKSLTEALNQCFNLGFYEAALDFALRGRELTRGAESSSREDYLEFTHKAAACLQYLDRAEQSIEFLAEIRRESTDAVTHMGVSYQMSMLYTRFLPKGKRDEDLALAWANSAIAFADAEVDPKQGPLVRAFTRNARALVELHRGNTDGALALVHEAIRISETGLGPTEQLLHRSVLLYNKARIHAALGEHEAALQAYDEVIGRDVDYGDYYFERAAQLRAADRHEEALADYGEAIRLNPPFFEAHFNRADLLEELGDQEGALQDLDYALELEPDQADLRLARASLLLARGALDQARADIEHGLVIEPENAQLLATRAQLLEQSGDAEAAYTDYGVALGFDPRLTAAWANRAILLYEAGRLAEAVEDLDHAIELDDDPPLRVNRAIALQDLGQHHRALNDLDIAVAALGEVEPDLYFRRGVSRFALEDVDGARADWRNHLAGYGTDAPSPYIPQIRLRAEDLLVAGVAAESAA